VLQVLRGSEPRAVVLLDDGRQAPFAPPDWERAA
jgi:hypothetical protein